MEENVYLGRYRICRDDNGSPVEAASGAGTKTYKAADTTDGREVLLQVLPVIGRPRRVREKLEAKALAAKEINHLNVPALLDFGRVGNKLVYVTEYFDGTSAQAWITEHGPMPIGAVLRIAAQMVGAIGAANFYGIVHHALHPGNVMLVPGQTPEGDWPLIKVVNFLGLAPSLTTAKSSGSGQHDPMNYASPEQLQDGKVDFRSEVYSLGCVLWFLLTGVPPFAGAVTVETATGVPGGVKELIAQMLAIDPSERQFDPVTLQEQIGNCITQIERRDALASKVGLAPASVAVVPELIQISSRRPLSWKPLALAALLLFAVALAAVVLPRSLRSGRLSARESEPIGVPIGIPETPPAPPIAEPATTSLPVPPSTGSPPVLVSTASDDDDARSSADSPEVAVNNAPADAPSSARDDTPPQSTPTAADTVPVTAQASGPPPPSDGPTQSSARSVSPKQEPTSLAERAGNRAEPNSAAENRAPTSASRSVSREPEAPVIESGPSKPSSVAKVKKHPKKTARYVLSPTEGGMPPLPRHRMRAQYLGTTPDGELVFGLPSSERVFMAPPDGQSEPPRRRRHRIIREPIEEIPVLPALPPDE